MCYCNPAIAFVSCGPECFADGLRGSQLGPIEAKRDTIAEMLDEIADMAEWWRKNRDKGRMPSGVRAGMLVLCEEIVAIKQSGLDA